MQCSNFVGEIKSVQRYFAELSFHGGAFAGWQIQPGVRTVQGELNLALQHHLLAENLMGCGRTDAGVHAGKFYAHFDTPRTPDEECLYKLNRMLPGDIVVHRFIAVESNAHARYDATSRVYHYRLHTAKKAFGNDTSAYIHSTLDSQLIIQACKFLVGNLNYLGFARSGGNPGTGICNVTRAEWNELPDNSYRFEIEANRFLRNMVRSIVGTLIEVGRGKREFSDIASILEGRNRSAAGTTAPACGLCLQQISYPYL